MFKITEIKANVKIRRYPFQRKPRIFTVDSPSYGVGNATVYRGRTRRHLTGLYAEEES